MKKEEIIALGVSEDIAEKVAKASTEELNGFVPKTRLDEVIKQRDDAQNLIKERDKQLEKLKQSSDDVNSLKDQIEQLQKDNKASSEKYKQQIQEMKVNNAVEIAIKERGGKNPKAIRALLELDKVEFNEDGTIKGLSEQLDALTKGDDSSFLFGEKQIRGFEPGKSGSEPPGEDISKMSYEQLCEYLEQHPDVKL